MCKSIVHVETELLDAEVKEALRLYSLASQNTVEIVTGDDEEIWISSYPDTDKWTVHTVFTVLGTFNTLGEALDFCLAPKGGSNA